MKKKINKKNSKNLWSGRFEESPSETMLRINSSISFDKTLYEKDISASKVHATMLSNQGIITKEELKNGYIFNLGHGISQYTSPDNVAILVDTIREY